MEASILFSLTRFPEIIETKQQEKKKKVVDVSSFEFVCWSKVRVGYLATVTW